jgi:hypothetical protein
MDTVSILRRPWGIWGLTEILWSGRNMRTGPRTSLFEGRIDYKELRKINPEAARKAVLEYLKTNEDNISRTAGLFGINRSVVYNIIRKDEEGDLKDRSKVPKCQPKKTSALIEDKVIEMKNKTHLGPKRLTR